ncbi:hypothetical protein [Georgenia wangjunii]|uniref:hypothetical protein n=1 Tax=Georgenia wangjunii TaxID=3117730 RepID=UPI002F26AA04
MTATLLEPSIDVGPGTEYYEAVHENDPALWDTTKGWGSAEPRICTPPLRPLTAETSWGFSVIEFARDVLDVELMPWQRALLIRMLELREDGTLRFATVVVLVARQNGKSTLSQVLALWFMLMAGWPLVLGTAQDLDVAEEVWEGAVELMLADGDEDEDGEGGGGLADLVEKVVQVNGKKALIVRSKKAPKGRARYKVKAANAKAGRGLSGNLILLDELRTHQNWGAWGAITKTTQAQLLNLVLGLSNAGDDTSVVLKYLRLMAHKALGDPDGILPDDVAPVGPTEYDLEENGDEEDELEDWEQDEDTLALFEWSTAPHRKKTERAGWSESNPARGYRIRDRKLASDCRTDPEWVFRTEVLCQWPDGTLEGPFPPGSWEQGQNEPEVLPDESKRVREEDRIVGPVVACVDVSHDHSQAYVVFAGRRADGVAQVEVVAGRHGSEWVRDWLMDDKRRDRIQRVTGQTKGAPVSPLMKTLKEDDDFTIEVVDLAGSDLLALHGPFFEAVRDVKVRHNPQPVLDIPAGTAVMKALGGVDVIDRRKSPSDVAPLVAAEGAYWLLTQREVTPPPQKPAPEAVTTTDTSGSITDDLADIGF